MKVVSANERLSGGNLQFTDLVVQAGITLTVPSGTEIRCTGTLSNEGRIVVEFGAEGAYSMGDDVRGALQGLALRPPGPGNFGGLGLSLEQARAVLHPGFFAGGGGGGQVRGGSGGGSLVVLCSGPITNNGDIHADGQTMGTRTGAGGGGGGFVIMVSKNQVTNLGTISAVGGDGDQDSVSPTVGGGGGGGGGGVVRLVAPTIMQSGNLLVLGGQGGNGVPSPNDGPGSAGGAMGGNGGAGSRPTSAAGRGGQGHIILDRFDPTALF